MLGLHFCVRAFSSCGERGPLFIAVRGPLSRPLLLRSTGSRRAGSVVVAHGPSCSAACGIFPDQGSNPCPLHWQADSQPLRHQGSPNITFLMKNILKETYAKISEKTHCVTFLKIPLMYKTARFSYLLLCSAGWDVLFKSKYRWLLNNADVNLNLTYTPYAQFLHIHGFNHPWTM